MESINPNISAEDRHRIGDLTKQSVHTYDSPGEWKGKEDTHVPHISINDNNTMLVRVRRCRGENHVGDGAERRSPNTGAG
jgi:hypothetical protein